MDSIHSQHYHQHQCFHEEEGERNRDNEVVEMRDERKLVDGNDDWKGEEQMQVFEDQV